MITSKSAVLYSFIWKFLERVGYQVVSFVVSLVLARLLEPGDYGLISIVLVFTNLAAVCVQGGLNVALIQKDKPQRIDYSSVLSFSIIVAFGLYCLLHLSAPLIARFYDNDALIPIIRVLSGIIILGAINSVQVAYVSKKMLFKKLCFANTLAAVFSGMTGILLAYYGKGIWALVVQQLMFQALCGMLLYFFVRWFPGFRFSGEALRRLMGFGTKIFASNFLTALFLDIRDLIIGKSFTFSDLAFFKEGKLFPQTIITAVDTSIQSVLLPAYSERQDDYNRVASVLLSSIRMSVFFIFPMMFGLASIARLLVEVLLTEKWLPCVPYLQIYCIIFAIKPLHTANMQALAGIGKSSILLKLDIIRKIIEVISIVIGFLGGVFGIAVGALVASIVSVFINLYPNTKILHISFVSQIKTMVLPCLGSLLMSASILVFDRFVFMPLGAKLVLEIVIGIAIYSSFSVLFNKKAIGQIIAFNK